MAKPIQIEVGDLVMLNKIWRNKIGLVQADDTAWYVIKNHFSIANCICKAEDVVRIFKKHAVPKKYCKYLDD